MAQQLVKCLDMLDGLHSDYVWSAKRDSFTVFIIHARIPYK